MIPEAAVEAAQEVAWARYGSRPDAAYLRAILEAAAPFMTPSAPESFGRRLSRLSIEAIETADQRKARGRVDACYERHVLAPDIHQEVPHSHEGATK